MKKFRVEQNKHPDISLEYENVNAEVEKMIKRALINKKANQKDLSDEQK